MNFRNAIELGIALRRRQRPRGDDLGFAGQAGDRHRDVLFLIDGLESVDVFGLRMRNNRFSTHHIDLNAYSL
jgi:hypothetical protein